MQTALAIEFNYADIYKTIKPVVRRVASRVPVVSEREDVEQELIIQVFQALDRYKERNIEVESLPKFAHTVASRRLNSYFRKVINREAYDEAFSYTNGANLSSRNTMGGNATQMVIRREPGFSITELRLDFQHNRHKFSKQEQRVVEWILEDDGSGFRFQMYGPDIANILGLHKSTVTRALQKLKEVCTAE